jgi:phosphoglucosamine mutase
MVEVEQWMGTTSSTLGQTLNKLQQLPLQQIVSTVMANLGFERAWEKQGGRLIRTTVGDQYVQAQMLQTGGMLGGEQSGHILCRHYGVTGDGLLTALHLAALVQQAGTSLSELVDQSFGLTPSCCRMCSGRPQRSAGLATM